MKVTLIQPRYFNIWEALGLAYIGAYVKRHYRRVKGRGRAVLPLYRRKGAA